MASGLRIPISGLKKLPTSTSGLLSNSKSLFAVLSRLPDDGVGQRVTQPRWAAKNIQDSYYTVTRVRLRANGRTGDARGTLTWKGKLLSNGKEQIIRGGHKHAWKHVIDSPEPTREPRALELPLGELSVSSAPICRMLTSTSTLTPGSNQAANMDIDSLIDAQFNRAVEIVQSLPKTGPIQTGYEEKLAMYSLYKQATQGNVKTSRPGVWDMLGRAKWDEWAKHKDMDTREAQWRYVLRKYPDRTIARDLIAELDSFAGDPNNLVMSSHSNMGASTSLHDRAETSSSGSSRTQGSPSPVRAALLEAQKQHFAHIQRPTDTGVFESSEDDETSESDTDEEAENAPPPPPHPQPQSQPQQRANSPPIVRPRSSLSSQYRYRTPVGRSNVDHSPAHSSIEQGPMPVVAGVPLTQPQPRYAAPSAFAPLSQQASALAFSPQQPTRPLHPAYHPHMQPPEAMASYHSHPRPAYHDVPRSRSPPRGTSMGLERAIIDIQASLSALRERMETIEQGGSFTSYSSRNRQSPPQRHSPLHPMLPFDLDPRSFGAWSVILTPLARSVMSARQLLQVIRRNPTMIIIRRLMLDISFLLALLAVIRACWKRFGGRRHEVISALSGIWVALVNGGKIPARRERILVDRGI
ncbi:unnamed protein product [Rhizoctonia solani]|uniref:ACB domain-containing protein n=1 Tax=Rhizoctonia solani TaxID=456999 RepID=A0A8H2WKY2_9AGAM|nr:unnamed protein product [Rhizoctonia solani]